MNIVPEVFPQYLSNVSLSTDVMDLVPSNLEATTNGSGMIQPPVVFESMMI